MKIQNINVRSFKTVIKITKCHKILSLKIIKNPTIAIGQITMLKPCVMIQRIFVEYGYLQQQL